MLTDRITPRRLTLLAVALALFTLAAVRFANPTPGAADPSYDSQESQFLMLLNNYRESQGRSDLVPQDDLNEGADWYATDMATKNYYGGDQYCYDNFHETAHCDSLGRMPGKRLSDFGYPPSIAGENTAAGFPDAQSVFNAWKASSAHNANMLYSGYKAVGIGWACDSQSDYGCYWVTDFGSYAGPGSPNPSETPTAAPTVPPPTATSTPPTTATPTPAPTDSPSPTPAPTDSPAPTPTPPPAGHKWDDVNCDGAITGDDAVLLLRGGAGFFREDTGCPSVWDPVYIGGTFRVWGDTDCSTVISPMDSIQILAYLAGLTLDLSDQTCPTPGTPF